MRRAYASVVAALSKPPVFLSIALGSAVIGLVFRVLWVTHAGRLLPTNSEMFFVARAFAETGRLADAYGPGSGLTAHVTPIMPILAGLVYRLTGVGTPAGEAALTLISIVLVGIGIVALNLAAKRLSIPPVARLAAIVFVCLIPINFHLEMGAFRVWEGAAATAVMAVVLAAILRMDAQPSEPSWLGMGAIAAVGGATALLSPPAALAIYGCLGLLALRKRGVFALVAVAGINYLVLKRFVFRSPPA